MLSEKEKEELLTIARRTLESYLEDRRLPYFESISDILKEPRSAFVSLYEGEALRGCIGCFDSPDPLYRTVQKMAVAAATEDPRFQSVQAVELPNIHIEISALCPRVPIKSIDEIQVGRHGICVEKDVYHKGVLLPQVAIANKWNREEFLTNTCLKAGLPPGAWEEGEVKIEIFTAEVFGEKR